MSFHQSQAHPIVSILSIIVISFALAACGSSGDDPAPNPSATQTLNITSAPVITVTQGQAYTYQVVAVDSDANATLSYELTAGPAGMTISATGLVSWDPATIEGGHNVTVTVNNTAAGLSSEQRYTLTVEHKLEITSTPVTTVTQGERYEYQLTPEDTDPNAVLTYALTAGPSGMAVDGSGLASWDPADIEGDHTVTVVVNNAAASLSKEQTFTLTVEHKLEIVSQPPLLATHGQAYEYQLIVEDTDPNAVLTYEMTDGPSGMAVDISGLISWASADSLGTPHSVTVTVNNDAGLSEEQTYSLSVISSAYPSQLLRLGDLSGDPDPEIGLLDLSVPATLSVGDLDDVNNPVVVTSPSITFSSDITPNQAVYLADADGAGSAAVALFGKRISDDHLVVQVIDLTDKTTIVLDYDFYEINSDYEFIDAVVLDEIEENGNPVLAVLAYDAALPRVKLEVVDLVTKTQVSRDLLDKGAMPIALAVIPDMQANGSPELAVLMQNLGSKFVKVVVDDAKGGFDSGNTPIQTLSFGSDATAEGLLIVNDINGNSNPEVAVLGRNYNTGSYRYRLQDASTNDLIERPWFPDAVAALDTANAGDVSGDSVEDIATVAYRLDTGEVDVIINSAKDGTRISQRDFNSVNNDLLPRGVVVLADMNSNGVNELALLGVDAGGDWQVEVRDASTHAILKTVNFQ